MRQQKKYVIDKNFFLAGLFLLMLFSNVLAADSCKDYSGSAKNICNAVANAKSDFKDKHFMSSNNSSTSKKLTSSCNELSGVEKENCLNKNAFVEQNVLTENDQTNTTSMPEVVQSAQSTRPSLQTQSSASNEITSGTTNAPPPVTNRTRNKVNIFNN